ncbi:hypothetical protein CK203_030136 [Vitis vinifera]|uniref:Uncharacterized protein n=1 Tax=Vitis vinifera TaxID=29760 RepID=A0A438I579_VITVI|nr:hypothetical protein CK203_030136 [Vitis vinifera]
MDYDDNDFQSQNLREEDNQWIEDFSRGSSGIEFSSSAAESCSISRRNNVWSEATSSESVEMLLNLLGRKKLFQVKLVSRTQEKNYLRLGIRHKLMKYSRRFSASGMQVDNIITSMHNVMTSAEELDNQKAPPDHINDISHGSGDALSKDNDVDGEEHNDLSKEGQMNDKVLEGNLVDSGAGNLEHPLYLDSEESRGEGNAVETCTSNVEGPSSTIVKGDSELNVVEGCSEGVKESVQESKCEELVLSKDTEMVNQFTGNMHGDSPIASKLTYGKSSFVKKKDDLLESGNQLNSEISTSHLDTSLLSEVTNKLSEVSRQSGIHNFDSDVPVVEDGNVKLSTDLSNMEHEIGGSLTIRECSRENDDDSASFGLIVVAVDFSSEHDTVDFILNEGKVEELTLCNETSSLMANSALSNISVLGCDRRPDVPLLATMGDIQNGFNATQASPCGGSSNPIMEMAIDNWLLREIQLLSQGGVVAQGILSLNPGLLSYNLGALSRARDVKKSIFNGALLPSKTDALATITSLINGSEHQSASSLMQAADNWLRLLKRGLFTQPPAMQSQPDSVQKIGRVRYDSAESYPPRSGPRRVRYQIPRLGLNRLDSDESTDIPRAVAVLGKKKKIEAKRGVAGEEEETEGRGLRQPGQGV